MTQMNEEKFLYDRLAELEDRIDELEAVLHAVNDWYDSWPCEPEQIPEPEFLRVKQVLKSLKRR